MAEYIFCVDSDGCVMDTMTYKHVLYFGPLVSDFFEIKDKDDFQQYWEKTNLYSENRGINRFVGLLMGLEYANVPEITHFKNWVETTNSLSNDSLVAEIEKNPDSQDLKQALEWSLAVNHSIKEHDGEAKAFDGALDGLEALKQLGKVVVVSSANKEAVLEEWEDQGLLPYVDDVYCQDRGKKEDVIASFIQNGVNPKNILMIGDSPGDCQAAEMNQVAFYPIIVGSETQSWKMLITMQANAFVEQRYDERYFKTLFWENLKMNK